MVWHAAPTTPTHRCSPILCHWPNTLLILNQVFGSPQEAQRLHMPLHLLHGLVNQLTFGSYRINQTALGPLIGWQSFSCPMSWSCVYSRGNVGIPLYPHILFAPFTSSTSQSPPPPILTPHFLSISFIWGGAVWKKEWYQVIMGTYFPYMWFFICFKHMQGCRGVSNVQHVAAEQSRRLWCTLHLGRCVWARETTCLPHTDASFATAICIPLEVTHLYVEDESKTSRQITFTNIIVFVMAERLRHMLPRCKMGCLCFYTGHNWQSLYQNEKRRFCLRFRTWYTPWMYIQWPQKPTVH